MTVIRFGRGEPNTIMSGVIELIQAQMWPLAILVFLASITVPLLKLAGLILMLVMTGEGSVTRLRDRTRLYRLVDSVGRWSMIDVFMITILVALVRMGFHRHCLARHWGHCIRFGGGADHVCRRKFRSAADVGRRRRGWTTIWRLKTWKPIPPPNPS